MNRQKLRFALLFWQDFKHHLRGFNASPDRPHFEQFQLKQICVVFMPRFHIKFAHFDTLTAFH
jgi:hypothetical protein